MITVHRSDAARNSSRAVSESDRAVEDGRSWISKEAIGGVGKEGRRRDFGGVGKEVARRRRGLRPRRRDLVQL